MASYLLTDNCSIDAGPITTDESSKADPYGILGSFDTPCAFISFSTAPTNKKPVIFDTGASSLAITYDNDDFDGPLTVPKGNLCLGGMANGLKIEGVGSVTWTSSNGDQEDVCVCGMAYNVPKAKARLLSPQRVFDAFTGIQGQYEGDHSSFRLYLDGCTSLIVEYDNRNLLPIGYATIGAVSSSSQHTPQMIVSLMDDQNENMTGGQKLLLQWHNRFGHLNFPSVQRIL